jgi:hypothetical protein
MSSKLPAAPAALRSTSRITRTGTDICIDVVDAIARAGADVGGAA